MHAALSRQLFSGYTISTAIRNERNKLKILLRSSDIYAIILVSGNQFLKHSRITRKQLQLTPRMAFPSVWSHNQCGQYRHHNIKAILAIPEPVIVFRKCVQPANVSQISSCEFVSQSVIGPQQSANLLSVCMRYDGPNRQQPSDRSDLPDNQVVTMDLKRSFIRIIPIRIDKSKEISFFSDIYSISTGSIQKFIEWK